MTIHPRTLAILGAAWLCAAAPRRVLGQGAPDFTRQSRKEVTDSVVRLLENLYADADTGRMIARHIRERAATGVYDTQPDWQHLVRVLTQDLQQVNADSHLSVDFAAAASAVPGLGFPVHPVEETRRLVGNVGYMRMSSFIGPQAQDGVTQAFQLLNGSDAMILDLRNARGGSAGLANYVISHFTGPDTTLVLIVYNRTTGDTTRRYTIGNMSVARQPTVPLYILTDDVTRSAAEDASFVLQNLHRAKIVGGTTAGAGRNNQILSIGHRLVASISFTRVMEPRTRREWERTGVVPDMRTAPESALAVAHLAAVKELAVRATSAPARRELDLVAEALAAASRKPFATGKQLARFSGAFEGGQFITVANGALVYQPRVHQPRVSLVQLSANEFADGASRYRFAGDGAAQTMMITAPNGTASTYRRVPQ